MQREALESFVLGDLLRTRATTHRNETFLKFHDGDLSYGKVDMMVDRVVQGLIASGVRPGEHIAVMLPNGPEIVYAIFALARLGAVAVPVNTAHRGEMLRHVLASSDSAMLVVDGAYADRLTPLAYRLPGLRKVIVRRDPADTRVIPEQPGKQVLRWADLLGQGADPPRIDVAFYDLQAIMYTSGTTGPSKGAMCSHALALTCAYDSLNYMDRWGKTVYCPLPLFHAAGLWDGVMSALLSGGAIAIVDKFHASTFWDDVRRFDASVALSVFSMIPILLSKEPSPDDRDNPLEMFYMGKSSLDEQLYERFGVRSVETYTSTEAGIAIGSPYGEWRTGSCGLAHNERFEVAVVDSSDREVGNGVAGELVLRPRQPFVLTTGYYGAPDATIQTFRNLWFHTGDRVWRDDDGYFYFLDRMKDSIRRRGENISAFDLECEVNLHPAVLECAAIGVPSELEEEEVKLAVVRQPGVRLGHEELITYCQEKLPRHMVPRYLEFVDELPRTPTEKVAKYRLRAEGNHGITPGTWDREASGPSGPAPGPDRSPRPEATTASVEGA
ncbi:MAG: AMP-binding protein [Streptosporangiales bacterium]|nr:AMP-binding protein [Streptosporangiales bacterium]